MPERREAARRKRQARAPPSGAGTMAYDEKLAERVRAALARHKPEEKAAFGGLAFMVNGKMAIGVMHDDLMVRVDPAQHDELVRRAGARTMEQGGRPMRGFLFVDPSGVATEPALRRWVDAALAFNPRARSAKKRTPKQDEGKRRRAQDRARRRP